MVRPYRGLRVKEEEISDTATGVMVCGGDATTGGYATGVVEWGDIIVCDTPGTTTYNARAATDTAKEETSLPERGSLHIFHGGAC